MDLSIELALGTIYFFIGLSMLFNRPLWLIWMENLRGRGPETALTIGLVDISIGAFIVSFHPILHGWPFLVTLIGLIAVLEGIVYLLCPKVFSRALAIFRPERRALFHFFSAVTITVGYCILSIWYHQITLTM